MSNWAEWEDSGRFPSFLRDGQTDYISFMVNFLGIYRPLKALTLPALKSGKYNRVIDGTAGAGGPVLDLFHANGTGTPIYLSDRFPNIPAAKRLEQRNPHLSYSTAAKDLTSLETRKDDLITCFNAFHHFDHTTRMGLLKKWSSCGSHVLIAEVLEKNILTFIPVTAAAVFSFLITPFLKPFRWDRLLFTYVLPAIPIAIAHDGWMSILKQPQWEEWEEMRTVLAERGYQCILKKEHRSWGCLTYIYATRT